MSVLLLNPNSHFEFEPKPTKKNINSSQTIVSVVFCIFVVTNVFSIVSKLDIPAKRITNKNFSVTASDTTTNTQLQGINSILQTQKLISEPTAQNSAIVPILIYHYTPNDFEAQVKHLLAKDYNPITVRQLSEYLYGVESLPPKPVVITFDDGFADQLKAVETLKKYQLKATFYFILGGEASHSCIGIERTNTTCGDSYTNWTQTKQILDTNLIEIGAHTLDHLDLPTQSHEVVWQQISESKRRLEDIFNIEVVSFAYPYGNYNAEIEAMVQKAGYTSAVTTQAGMTQTTNNRYTMPRIRNAYSLP